MTHTMPMSVFQKNFLLEWQINPNSDLYNLSLVYKIDGSLDASCLKRSCELFISKYKNFHANFGNDGTMTITSNYCIDDFYHFIKLPDYQDSDLVNETIKDIIYKPFDLANHRLLKFYLIEASVDKFYFVTVVHHIIADGTTLGIISKEIQSIYNQLISGVELVEYATQDLDVVSSDSCFLFDDVFQRNAQKFWLDFIGDIPLNTSLPYSNKSFFDAKDALVDKHGKTSFFEFDKNITQALKSYASSKGSTLFVFLASIFGIVLSKYSNQQKILMGYSVNVRSKDKTNTPGCFVNNIPLKIELDEIQTLGQILLDITKQRREVKKYQDYPLMNIINDQRINNGIDITNYLNVAITQTNLGSLPVKLHDLMVEVIDLPWSSKSIPEIGLLYDENNLDKIKFKLEYRSSLFTDELASNIANSFKQLVHDILLYNIDNEFNIQNYHVLSNELFNKVIYEWNDTAKQYPYDRTLHELFEEQVIVSPHQIAVRYGEKTLTYHELNVKANQMAHYLRHKYDILGDKLVALCLERNELMIVAIIAVLKSGAAYVPLDPSYPSERMAYILQDTQAITVIVNEKYQEKFSTSNIAIELIDGVAFNEICCNHSEDNLHTLIDSKNLAYIIYTSGTTGNPKGVMIEHCNAVNEICYLAHQVNMIHENVLFTANYIFDASVEAIFTSFISGSTLHVIDKEHILEAHYINDYINQFSISCINTTPSYFQTLGLSRKIKILILGGEACNDSFCDCAEFVYNTYGPTETTIISTCGLLNANTQITIGRPIDNTSIYILDNNLNPLPIGAIGELFIGGAGVARGYLNLPDLTADKFIPNPFQSEKQKLKGINSRLYKTGDLVRYLSDASIEYIGRNDFQVKIRGLRIELSEIESSLTNINGIKQAIVMVKDSQHGGLILGDSKYIIAYYVSDSPFDNLFIQQELQNSLPEYMIPHVIIHLEAMPLTLNGKLDRKALPESDVTLIKNYQAPTNNLELEVCKIFAKLLNKSWNQISIDDSFFSIGGSSLLAIKLLYEIQNSLKLKITAFDIFQKKTVRNIVNKVDDNFVEYETYYELNKKHKSLIKNNLLIFIPGCEPGFERNYETIANEFIDSPEYKTIMLKANFTEYARIENQVAYYYNRILEYPEFNSFKTVIIIGFSAGGEIGYLIAGKLKKIIGKKLRVVLIDPLLNRNNFLEVCLRKITKSSNNGPVKFYKEWQYHTPIIKMDILYIKATQFWFKQYIVPRSAKLRWLRQFKAVVIYHFTRFRYESILMPLLLKFFIKRTILLDGIHWGENGIMTQEFTPLIKKEIDKFISGD